MRLDSVSGWQLMAVQLAALAVLAPVLWLAGVGFQRSGLVRRLTLVLAPAAGTALAVFLLNTDETIVASYLFAVVLFSLGTLAMSIMLLAAIPQTRDAALGGLIVGSLLFM